MRYANRAKNIKNRARINEDPKDALLRQFQIEIEELRKQLEENAAEISDSDGDTEDSDEIGETKKERKIKHRMSQMLSMDDLQDVSESGEKIDRAEKEDKSPDTDVIELKRTQWVPFILIFYLGWSGLKHSFDIYMFLAFW